MSSAQQKENAIILRIDSDYVYEFNTANLEFTSSSRFELTIASRIEIIEISQGTANHQEMRFVSEEKDGVFAVKLIVLGIFHETRVRPQPHDNPAVNAYGMRYYPFISSHIRLEVADITLPIHTIMLSTPESFRVIWYRKRIINPENQEARICHSYATDKARYIFTWDNQERGGSYSLDIPIRLGGQVLWQVVQFPQYYFYVALVAIALASFHNDYSVLFAAIIGTWLFIMGHWSKLAMPQRNTIAAQVYVAFLFTSLFWGLACKFSYFLAAILAFTVWWIMKSFRSATAYFNREGRLPKAWERLFFIINSTSDTRNR